jgi:hypothetical protein
MIASECEGRAVPDGMPNSSCSRIRHVLHRAWGRAPWKMVAIIAFTTKRVMPAAIQFLDRPIKEKSGVRPDTDWYFKLQSNRLGSRRGKVSATSTIRCGRSPSLLAGRVRQLVWAFAAPARLEAYVCAVS